MISDRKRTYVLSALLAVPPVVLAGAFFSHVTPQPERVPTVVSANDPEVETPRLDTAKTDHPSFFQLAKSFH